VAELFACGLASESDRRLARDDLRPIPRGRPPNLSHAYFCLAQAADLALRQWSCCSQVLELLMSSARLRPWRALYPERVRDRDRIHAVLWRQMALAEGLAAAVGQWPDCRHPAPRQWVKMEECDHGQGSAYQPRPFGRRCQRCGHFIGQAAAPA
jgi:hypothetical protein